MAKEKAITIDGIIQETMPNAMFRVDVEIGGNNHTVLAHVSGKMRMHFIKMLPGFRFESKGRDLPTLPFFSTDEHNKMQDVILSWIREGRHGWRDRYIFSNLIGLSAFSGLKSVELGQLSYRDFFLRDEILCCNIESSRAKFSSTSSCQATSRTSKRKSCIFV